MSRSTIGKQLEELRLSEGEFPEYREILQTQRAINEVLLPMEEQLITDFRSAMPNDKLDILKERAKESKRPLLSFLDPSIFDERTTFNVVKKITKILSKRSERGKITIRFQNDLEWGEIRIGDAVRAIFAEDSNWFQSLSGKYDIEPPLLLQIFSAPLRPFFEELARRVEGDFVESWWEPFCPVCGRTSVLATVRHGKRFMICPFCGDEYVVDQFLCVNCGNRDPQSLGFIAFDGHPEYELHYCEKCQHYTKTIKEGKLRRKIPKGLEDLLTQDLDILATRNEIGLKRT